MEIDQEDSSNVFFGNTIPGLDKPARHTVKQRRWRAHRKQKLYSTQLSLPVPTVEQIVEQDLCLSSSDEILNEINLGHVARGSSLNATARCLVRTAYGETASFNDLASGGFDLLL
ncbi:unnamed protein product, partial [Rotaria sp. Silwood1]